MFKSSIAILLLCCLMLTNFSRMFVFSAFTLNQKYIASTLCINRDKPEMHCNGKCYLANKIKQVEEKEKKEAQDGQKKGFQDHFISKESAVQLTYSLALKKQYVMENHSALPKRSAEVLHPPPASQPTLS